MTSTVIVTLMYQQVSCTNTEAVPTVTYDTACLEQPDFSGEMLHKQL